MDRLLLSSTQLKSFSIEARLTKLLAGDGSANFNLILWERCSLVRYRALLLGAIMKRAKRAST